ncbi:hypothetical protein HCU74_14025 [Spongiibacter sp. KMU-166]|uniref:Uncharacterized protein n=1 Tax=Spongiibacter thalassae TaxID=2721624 RepID=A0ABX1GH37_9GAMM|nr:hypothetical protein [Spongiibacter thalassae]NKI18530.1 hypothetical protein [Spongiibacter thalassae]
MLNASQVPDWTVGDSIEEWWSEMAGQGVAFHPDDMPDTIVFQDSGRSCFGTDACTKLERILSSMLNIHGDEVYDVGQAAIMGMLGWAESPDKSEWVRSG